MFIFGNVEEVRALDVTSPSQIHFVKRKNITVMHRHFIHSWNFCRRICPVPYFPKTIKFPKCDTVYAIDISAISTDVLMPPRVSDDFVTSDVQKDFIPDLTRQSRKSPASCRNWAASSSLVCQRWNCSMSWFFVYGFWMPLVYILP